MMTIRRGGDGAETDEEEDEDEAEREGEDDEDGPGASANSNHGNNHTNHPLSNLQALHPPPHSRSKDCGLVSTQECHCGGKKHRQRRHLIVRVGVWGVVWVRDLGVESFRFENDVQVANKKNNTK